MTETQQGKTRWGILATGRIAHDFARNLGEVPGAELAAVGSRSLESAEAFAREHGDSVRAHGSYESLVADPDVDIVYVATPHAFHLENARAAFAAGKHVLCEKPLTLNLAEAEAMVAAAGAAGRFLMEAMWMACNPVIRAVREGIAEGRFGTPRQVHADLGFVVKQPPTGRLFNPELGGGALLDMGIYPLTFAHLMLGPADHLVASATLSNQGVDLDVAVAGRHGDAVSALTASMTSASPCTATIATTDGRIDVPAGFHAPAYATWTPSGGEPERIDGLEPIIGTGLGNEAAHVQECLHAGRLESPLVPHAQTLTLIRQMDDVRRQIGVSYASDAADQQG
jgi:predicted dehydrogenase